MSKLETLADAFYSELQDMYSAEQQLAKALPKLSKRASCKKLNKALNDHLEQTKKQVERVAQAFEETGKAAKAKKCEAMAGLLREAEEMMAEATDPDVADAVLIGLAQKVEHYEIATYGTLCTWAELLGYSAAKKLLGQNLCQVNEHNSNFAHPSERIGDVGDTAQRKLSPIGFEANGTRAANVGSKGRVVFGKSIRNNHIASVTCNFSAFVLC
jgi:ferritin-like metal-binding protein YciE